MSLPSVAAEFLPRIPPEERAGFTAAVESNPELNRLGELLASAEHTQILTTQELDRVLDFSHPARHALRLADYDQAQTDLTRLQEQYRQTLLAELTPRYFPPEEA